MFASGEHLFFIFKETIPRKLYNTRHTKKRQFYNRRFLKFNHPCRGIKRATLATFGGFCAISCALPKTDCLAPFNINRAPVGLK